MRRNVPILPALFLALAVVAASRAGAQNLPEQAKPNPAAGPGPGSKSARPDRSPEARGAAQALGEEQRQPQDAGREDDTDRPVSRLG